MDALLSLGSNQGNRLQVLNAALAELEKVGSLVRCSSLYETQPWALPEDTPPFCNAVVWIQTSLPEEELWAFCMEIERQAGRIRHREPSPVRPLDVDLLLYGGLVLRAEHLVVPHPSLHLRRFVLVPAVEIAPEFHHPVLGKSLRELLDECRDSAWVRLYARLESMRWSNALP